MTFEGANSQAGSRPARRTARHCQLLIGDDPSKWHEHSDLPEGRIQNVYEGIDLVYYGNQGRLEYDLIVAPGANPSQIKLALGAEQIAVDEQGDLVLSLPQSIRDCADGGRWRHCCGPGGKPT